MFWNLKSIELIEQGWNICIVVALEKLRGVTVWFKLLARRYLELPTFDNFWLIFHEDCEIEEDMMHKIKTWWLNREVFMEFHAIVGYQWSWKKNSCRTNVRPTILYHYGSKYWVIKKNVSKMSVIDMRMLTWMNNNTLRDKRRNKSICNKWVTLIEDKMRENQMTWFRHI